MDWFDTLNWLEQAVVIILSNTFLIFAFSALTIVLGKLFFRAMDMIIKRVEKQLDKEMGE